MDDLAKADLKTVRTFIDNQITADRLLEDVLPQKKDQAKLKEKKSPENGKKATESKSQQIFDSVRIIND